MADGNGTAAQPSWEPAGERAAAVLDELKAAARIAKDSAAPQPIAGRLIVTWPTAVGAALPPFQCALADAGTGEQITTATKMVIVADCASSDPILADLTMLCDQDGQFLRAGGPVLDGNGGFYTGVFRWVVVEMRTGGEPGNCEAG